MIKTFGGDTLVELVDDDKTTSCHIQDKLDRDEDVNIAFVFPRLYKVSKSRSALSNKSYKDEVQ
jgi:hypothetical protein